MKRKKRTRQPTEARGFRVLGYENRTFPNYLRDLYQYVLCGVDSRRRVVFQDKFVGLSDSKEERGNGFVEVRLRQDQLFGIASTATFGMRYAHLGGFAQRTQRHLSVWVYLWMAIRQD